MTSRRTLKAAAAIREVVSMSILTELRDPRIQHVTVTQVEVSPDMQQAKVYISIMGDEKAQDLCLHGLQSASGFLQQKISKRIDTRYTPRLKFLIDKGVKNSLAVAEILRQVLPPKEEDNLEAETSDGEPNEETSVVEDPAVEPDQNRSGDASAQDSTS